MFKFAKKIVQNKTFQNVTMGVILLASILVGVETYPIQSSNNYLVFQILDTAIQIFFTVEIAVRILAFGHKPLIFFRSGANIFDFMVTALFYLPYGGAFVSVFRLIRIFRVFRLFTALPQLQIMVGALIKSIPSIGYITLLLLIQFYIFAVIGTHEFGRIDPSNFGNLGQTMMTLFQVVTLEGWVEIYKGLGAGPFATIYFISFILLGTMIILNLFIGVITSGFDEVKKEVTETSEQETEKLTSDLISMRKQVAGLSLALEKTIIKHQKNSKK